MTRCNESSMLAPALDQALCLPLFPLHRTAFVLPQADGGQLRLVDQIGSLPTGRPDIPLAVRSFEGFGITGHHLPAHARRDAWDDRIVRRPIDWGHPLPPG